MKRIIFIIFLLVTCLGFSNTVLDRLVGGRWSCNYLSGGKTQIIFLHVTKESPDKYNVTFNEFVNVTKEGPEELEVGDFTLAVNETEQYFYFPKLNKNSLKFADYRFKYELKKRDKIKFSLYKNSGSRQICEFHRS